MRAVEPKVVVENGLEVRSWQSWSGAGVVILKQESLEEQEGAARNGDGCCDGLWHCPGVGERAGTRRGKTCCLKQISPDTVSVCQWKVGLLVKPSMHRWVRQG